MRSLFQKFKTARRMPPKVLIESATRLTKRGIRRYTIKFHHVKLSDKDFLNVTGYRTIDDFLSRNPPRFFFNSDDKERTVEEIKKECPRSIEQTINDADEICNHIFDLLGSGKTELGEEIDWHLDFKSGFRWDPKEYYPGTGKHVTLNDPSDVKVPWELSRCQHFVTLGKAYWYNKESKMQK
jgi:hypothetical protein